MPAGNCISQPRRPWRRRCAERIWPWPNGSRTTADRRASARDTLSAAPALYVPLGDTRRQLGVLAVLPENRRRVMLPEQRHLLETFAGQTGLALERALLAEQAESARVRAEGESLRNTLLASISHDLRTPLAVMAGAGSTLAEHGASLDEATRATLARSIETKAREMSELISNVLDLTRLESGQVRLRYDWQTLDELVESALRRLEEPLTRYGVELRLPPDLPPVYVDAGLITQVFTNLLDNIVKYTPPGTHIQITAAVDDGGARPGSGSKVRVTVDDDGPGLPVGDPGATVREIPARHGRGHHSWRGTGTCHLPGDCSRAWRGRLRPMPVPAAVPGLN